MSYWFDRLKSIVTKKNGRPPVLQTVPEKYRALLQSPVTDQDELQKRWNKPATRSSKNGKNVLVCAFVTVDEKGPAWSVGVRVLGRNSVKLTSMWLHQEKVYVRSVIDEHFTDVGDWANREYFYSSFAAHVIIPLTELEMIDYEALNGKFKA